VPFQLAERPGDQKGSKKEEKLDSSLMVEYSILRGGKSVQAHNGLCNIYNVITKETPELTSGSHTPAVDDAERRPRRHPAPPVGSEEASTARSFEKNRDPLGGQELSEKRSLLNLWYDREINVYLSPSIVNSR